MKYYKIKSYCKINLFLKVIKKLNSGYHNIVSLVTFCNLYDLISISKINAYKDEINFSGQFRDLDGTIYLFFCCNKDNDNQKDDDNLERYLHLFRTGSNKQNIDEKSVTLQKPYVLL